LKNIKRVMAGEYSRELSTKVFDGQCRAAKLGYWMGGPAPYGYRRQLFGADGKPKGILQPGEQMALQGGHIVLIPGPKSEQRVVKRIFKSFAIDGKTRTQIAADLNADGILNARGRSWTMLTVHNILKNEAYIGHGIYARKSTKVGTKGVVRNPPEDWVRHNNAFEAVIEPGIFALAQKGIAERQHRLSNQELLDRLSGLLRKKKHLSVKIMSAAKGMPSPSCYTLRFGSLGKAYERVGFTPDPKYDYQKLKAKVESAIGAVAEEVVSNIGRLGGSVNYFPELQLLTINSKLTVAIGVATAVADGRFGPKRWQLRKFKFSRADFSLVLKMDGSNTKVEEYYLLPTSGMPVKQNYKLRLGSRVFSQAFRHESLGAFYRMWTQPSKLTSPPSSPPNDEPRRRERLTENFMQHLKK